MQQLFATHMQWSIGYDPGGWGEVKIFYLMNEEDDDLSYVRAKFNGPSDFEAAISKAVGMYYERTT